MLEPQQGMSVDEILEIANYAEKSGYGYIFRSDHILSIGSKKGKPVSSPECWVSLGALAARTKKIKFGPMVSPIGFRNPAMLGRMASTIHSFSKGRLCLGLGAGWFEDEYVAHGYPFPAFRVRRKQLIEGFEIIRPMSEGKEVDFNGEYFSAHVDCYPKPYGKKIHLIGGGRSPRIVRTIAKYVDEWNIFGSPLSVYSSLKTELDQAKGNGNIKISQMGSFIIGDSRRELSNAIRAHTKAMGMPSGPDSEKMLISRGILCGTREEFVAQVNERRDAGIEKFYFQLWSHQGLETRKLLTEFLKREF
jgi:alkanesulfonate monooxygenase SsuD/methylene tetrahydromethanopterin reductase-like flavin-dependent oxidoreductase (luciferase family)